MRLDQLLRVGVNCVKRCSNGSTHATVVKLVEEDALLSVGMRERWHVDPVDEEEAVPARTGGQHSRARGDGGGGRGGDGGGAEDGDARAAAGDAEPDDEDGGGEGVAGGVSQPELIASKHVTIVCLLLS